VAAGERVAAGAEVVEGGTGAGADGAPDGWRITTHAAPPAIRISARPIIDTDDDEAEASDVGSRSPQFGQAVTTVLTTL
jgi:hypothetical protein